MYMSKVWCVNNSTLEGGDPAHTQVKYRVWGEEEKSG